MAFDFLTPGAEETELLSADALRETCAAVFQAVGVPEEDARIAADIVVLADLRGVDSHGAANMRRLYVGQVLSGFINPRPKIHVVHEARATATLDGDRGLGLVVAYRAMEKAIAKAREAGSAFVTARNSRHSGMMGYYSAMAMDQGMIGYASTNAAPHVLPLNGVESRVGTNPISLGAPGERHPGFLLDMATSVVAANKVNQAARMGVEIPQGWALSEDGQPLTRPTTVGRNFHVFPLGGDEEHGGQKGYGLAVMVDILCGVLSGQGTGERLYQGYSQCFMAIDISRVRPLPEFKGMLDEMVDAFHNVAPVDDGHRVKVAGEPEWDLERERRAKGIPLLKGVAADLRQLAAEVGARASI